MSEIGEEMQKFNKICKMVIPERVSIITNYGDWEDRLIMKGPHLNISVRKINIDEDLVIRVSDERGLSM